MNNRDVAAVFDEMAELLRLKGGDPHRSRAFSRAAKVLEALPEPVDAMLRSGKLQRIPAIGEGTVHRVKQILRRGTCDDLDRLRRQIPPGLLQLLEIKGLGPRTVRTLHQRLRVHDVDSLEAAARNGRLRTLPRFGVDTVHALLGEIAAWRARQGKIPLPEALRIAAGICEWMLGSPDVVRAIPGGSMRRMRAMVGDLDILAAAHDTRAAVARFVSQPGTREILAQGDTEASVRLASGRQTDLWSFPPECWGAGLHSWSGSKEHVVALRTRAGRMGYHITDQGVFTRDRSRRVTSGETEEEIYALLDLQWVTPELREGLGEIELAAAGKLPTLVTAGDLRGDLHLHTTASDGKATTRQMARTALELGYEYLAITDHSKALTVANGLDEARLLTHRGEILALEAELDALDLLPGVEVDIHADGSLDIDAAVLAQLDWVVASVHDHFELDREAQTARLVRAMESGLVDVLGHPTGRKLGRREAMDLDLDRVLTTARRLGVAVEVNGGPYRMDLDDVGCRAARELGVTIVVDTDAHSPAELRRPDFALAMARRGGLEARHVLNTRPIDEVRAHRRDRLRHHGVAVPEARRRAPAPAPATSSPAATTAPTATASVLGDELAADTLAPELLARVREFLETGDDPELAAALAGTGANPVQAAFGLLARHGALA